VIVSKEVDYRDQHPTLALEIIRSPKWETSPVPP
jgi:hypothetical protein